MTSPFRRSHPERSEGSPAVEFPGFAKLTITEKADLMQSVKKKVLVPIFNRAHYGRLRSVLRAIQNHPDLELQIMVGLPHAYGNFFDNLKHSRPRSLRKALPWYFKAQLLSLLAKINPTVLNHDFLVRNIRNDGYAIHSQVPLFLDGGTSGTMARTVGLGMVRMVDELKRLRPNVVFVNADRFEMMAVALAAAYLGIPIAHNEGGDISGTLDESIRHAITKLSHIHFTGTKQSHKRVLQMGENPEHVHIVGSPAIDVVADLVKNESVKSIGSFNLDRKFLLVLAHPVVTETGEANAAQTRAVLESVDELALPTIFIGSNIDARSNVVGNTIRSWHEKPKNYELLFVKNLPPDDFYSALSKAAVALGNSSSFIREGAFFGTPAVIVGSRQHARERGSNIVEVAPNKVEIVKAIKRQIAHGPYKADHLFGDGTAGEKIATILARSNPAIQKTFHEA